MSHGTGQDFILENEKQICTPAAQIWETPAEAGACSDPFTDNFYPNGQPRPAAVYLEDMLKNGPGR
jgi:hypothetical protein